MFDLIEWQLTQFACSLQATMVRGRADEFDPFAGRSATEAHIAGRRVALRAHDRVRVVPDGV